MKNRSNLLVWVLVIPVLTWLDRWKKWSDSLVVLLMLLSYIQAKTRALFQFQSTLVLIVTYLARSSNKALVTKEVEMSGILPTSMSVVTRPVSTWDLKVSKFILEWFVNFFISVYFQHDSFKKIPLILKIPSQPFSVWKEDLLSSVTCGLILLYKNAFDHHRIMAK